MYSLHIVIIDRTNNIVELLELTVSFEPNMANARKRKEEKYSSLVSDIENNGFRCKLTCFEVGSRGLITKENRQRLIKLIKWASFTQKTRQHINQISKIVILTSYAIYNARRDPTWTMPKLLLPT